MTIEQANVILRKVKFLNYKFEITHDNNFCAYLNIRLRSPDTSDRTKWIELVHQSTIQISYLHNEQFFIETVFERLIDTLRHEAGELFTIDGKDPFNQHKEHQTGRFEFLRAMFTPEERAMYHHIEMYENIRHEPRTVAGLHESQPGDITIQR